MRMLRTMATCTALLLATGAALAGERHVPGQYTTIQAAVDACASGDVVVCAAGNYAEAVVATKSNITIQGATGATWDGGTGASAKNCLDVTGNAVVVTGFKFKNGLSHVKLKGDDCKVKNCVSEYAAASFCVVEGARAKVESCGVSNAVGAGIKIVGNAAACTYATVKDCDDVGIRIEGDDCVKKYNRVDRCKKGAYHCKGKRPYCYGNEAYGCAEFGLHLEGDAGVAVSNYVEECGSAGLGGFVVTGSDVTLKYCDSWKSKGNGHKVRGDRNWCYDNWSDYDEECGFDVEGDENDCDYGRARNCKKDGHRYRGDDNDFYECDSDDNDDDGFDCDGGARNKQRYCNARRNGGAGCENGGSGTSLTGCVLLYNTVDIGLDGSLGASFGSLSFNVFGSGGVSTILKIGLGL